MKKLMLCMMGKSTPCLYLALLLIATITLSVSMTTVNVSAPPPPGPGPTIWANPSRVEYFNQANLTCTHFNVTIDVYNFTDLQAWEFKLWFNNTLLNCTGAWPTADTEDNTDFVPIAGPPTYEWIPINNTLGRVWAGALFPLGSPFTGNGSLLTIEFHIIKAPPLGSYTTPQNRSVSCPLILNETYPGDSSAVPIDHGTQDGYYEYIRPQNVILPPVADFTWTPTEPYVCDNVTCTSNSTPNGGSITAWNWSITGPATNTSAMDQDVMTFHCDGAGTVNVTLLVWDSEGLNGTVTHSIEQKVGVPPVALFTWWTNPATKYIREHPCVNETLNFDASASTPDGGDIVSYAWDFDGDGVVDKTGKVTTWNFTTVGTHTVTLNVTDSEGLWDTVSHDVEVVEEPYISLNPQEYTAPTIGHTFIINVTITDVTDLQAWEFKLWYNTTILDAVNCSYAGLVTEDNTDWIPINATNDWIPINDTLGRVWAGALFPLGSPYTGSAVLLRITFISTALGNTTLHLNETVLGDDRANSIPHDIIPAGLVQAEIEVVPEFPAAIIMSLLLIATTAAAFLGKMLRSRKRKDT